MAGISSGEEELTSEQYGEEELTSERYGEEELTREELTREELTREELSSIKLVFHRYRMLLIGETGSGKTSFLNLLCNSKLIEELGTKVNAAKLDQIKHYNDLAIEDSTTCAMASKTSEAMAYKTELCKMRMTVIDTPGFGDSRGLEQDKVNVKKIIDALENVENEDYINCICLVINGRLCRMTASLQYVLGEISAILPREVFNNIIVVFTNTADPLDCSFDTSELIPYFSKKIEHVFYIENPYCKIEKVKQRYKQASEKEIVKNLASFENSCKDATEPLRLIQETIKDFKDVHTHHFTTLFIMKQEIEKDFITILASYDQQTELEKEIKTAEEEVDAALKSQKLYTDFSTTREVKVTELVPTSDKRHNLLCGAPGCYTNCHTPCYLDKSYNRKTFKRCKAMGGTKTCKVCGHSYKCHYHNKVVFKEVTESKEFVNEEMKQKFKEATSIEQRADCLRQGLQTRREELEREKDNLLQELIRKLDKFQELGISKQNYAKVLEKQLDVVKLRREVAVGDECAQLNAVIQSLEKQLEFFNPA